MIGDNSRPWDGSTSRRNLVTTAVGGLGALAVGGIGLLASSRPVAAIGSGELNATDIILDDNETGVSSVYIQPKFGEIGNENNAGIEWKNFSEGVNQIDIKIQISIDDQSEILYDLEKITTEPAGVATIELDGDSLDNVSGSISIDLEKKDIISDSENFTKDDFPQNVQDGGKESQDVEIMAVIYIKGSGNSPTLSDKDTFSVIIDNPDGDGSFESDTDTEASG